MKELATRKQLAEMTGYTTQHIKNMNFLPPPIKKKRTEGFYDVQEALRRYHEKRDSLAQQKVSTNMVTEVKKDLEKNPMLAFIAGRLDRQDIKNQYKLKKLASKTTKPKTQKIQLFDEWDSPRKRHHKLYK